MKRSPFLLLFLCGILNAMDDALDKSPAERLVAEVQKKTPRILTISTLKSQCTPKENHQAYLAAKEHYDRAKTEITQIRENFSASVELDSKELRVMRKVLAILKPPRE